MPNKTMDYNRSISVIGRLSYPHLGEPVADNNDPDRKKWSCALLFPKNTKNGREQIAKIKKAIEAVRERDQSRTVWGGTVPKKLSVALRDGDEEKEDPNYEGMMFVNANSYKRKPRLCNKKTLEPLEEDAFYPGCWVVASINFYPYDKKGNKGIACGLNDVMFWRDDEPFGATPPSLEEAFGEFADIEEDEDF